MSEGTHKDWWRVIDLSDPATLVATVLGLGVAAGAAVAANEMRMGRLVMPSLIPTQPPAAPAPPPPVVEQPPPPPVVPAMPAQMHEPSRRNSTLDGSNTIKPQGLTPSPPAGAPAIPPGGTGMKFRPNIGHR